MFVKISSSMLPFPDLALRVLKFTFCNRFKFDANLIISSNDSFSDLELALASPIPFYHTALGKLKSPVKTISGTGAVYLSITLFISSITVFLNEFFKISP